MKKILMLAMELGLLVSGCSGGYLYVQEDEVKVYKSWRKPGTSVDQLQRDYEECNKLHRWAPAINSCMKSRGYKWE